MWRVAEIEEAALIVAAQVRPKESKRRRSERNLRKRLQRCVFDFILVPGCRGKVRQQVTGLCVYACAVVLVLQSEREIAEFRGGDRTRIRRILRATGEGIRGEETLHGIGDEFVIVRFGTSEMMVPVLAGGKIPAGIRAEEMIVGVLIEIRRLQERLARRLRAAGIVAQRQPQLIVFAQAIAKISGERPVQKAIFVVGSIR